MGPYRATDKDDQPTSTACGFLGFWRKMPPLCRRLPPRCAIMLSPMRGPAAAIFTLLSVLALWTSEGGAASARSFRDCANCPLMSVIPAGRFVMGSPASETGRTDAEGPQHDVVIAHAFAVSVFDVSRSDFEAFARESNFSQSGAGCGWRAPRAGGAPINQSPTDPVVCVSWNDAQAYLAWLSARTGKHYRLLTESEWEYAARAGTTSARPWGEHPSHEQANTGADRCCAPVVSGRDRWLHTSPAGSFPANRFGLADMIGNVWQWVEDCASDDYVAAPTNAAARAGAACELHIVRGGSWFHPPDMARSASRVADRADFRIGDIGFRVAETLSTSP